MSPTARTLIHLRRRGYTADPVERFVAGAGAQGRGIRRDWGRFGDVLACHPGRREILIVQATSRPNVGARLAKSRAQPALAAWLAAGGRFEVHGWALRRGRWHVKVVEVRGVDLAAIVLEAPPRRLRQSRYRPPSLFDG